VNLITPDNFEKKFEELRIFMFGEYKFPLKKDLKRDSHKNHSPRKR